MHIWNNIMNMEEFEEYLREHVPTSRVLSLKINPCLSIKRFGRRLWKCYGFCRISGPSFNEVLIEGYKGKSEEPMIQEKEKNAFIDMLYEVLKDACTKAGIGKVDLHFEEVKIIAWGSWN
jgi:hypothetical protein